RPLVCLSHTGKKLWELERDGNGSSPILVDLDGDDHHEIIVGVGSELIAVSGEGKVLWSHALSNTVDGGLCAADADRDGAMEIYAVDLSGQLVCLTTEGKVRWSASVGMRARRSPSIGDIDGDGVVEIIVGSYSAKIHLFSPDGKLETTLPLPAATNATPSIAFLKEKEGPYLVCPSTAGAMTTFHWSNAKHDALVLWPQYRSDSARAGAANPAHAASSVAIEAIDFGNHYVGSDELRVEVSNPDQRKLTIQLEVVQSGKKPLRHASQSSDERIEAALGYSVGGIAATDLTLNCRIVDDGKTVARRSRSVSVVPFRKELSDLRQMLVETGQAAAVLPKPREIEGTRRFLERKLGPFRQKAAVAGTLSDVQRRRLRDEIADTLKQANRLHCVARTAAALRRDGKGPIRLSMANPWAPFAGIDEIIEDRLQPAAVKVEAFRGETESAALNVFNLGSDPLNVRVEIDPLEQTVDGKKRTVRARDVIVLHEAVEVATQTLDLSADAIPELNQANLMILPAWDARQLWLNVDTSKLDAGRWTTHVRLRSLEVESREFSAPLEIVVWKPQLPTTQPLRLCHWGYVPGSLLGDQPQAALDDQVTHGTNVFVAGYVPKGTFDEQGNLIGDIDYRAHDDYVRRYGSHGLILFQHTGIISGPGGHDSPAYRKAHVTLLREWVDHLAKMGIGYGGFALYPVDEPGLRDGLVDIYLSYAKLAREADPKIQMYTDPVARITMDEIKRMLPYVDIWCPNRAGFLLESGKEKLDLMRSSGKTLWNYECAGNAKHRSPLGYYRGQAWLAWHHGLTGIGFWSYCTSSADPWYRPQATLDYLLIYQGKGVVSSKRWEAIRDGIEDYSMLTTLREAVAKGAIAADALPAARKLLGEEASVIARFCGLDNDGTEPGKTGLPGVRRTADRRWQQIQKVRRQIASMLEGGTSD
ncbi:MAG: glycoside hydrolase domain-containing protein, partial [Pirellulales bacterium]